MRRRHVFDVEQLRVRLLHKRWKHRRSQAVVVVTEIAQLDCRGPKSGDIMVVYRNWLSSPQSPRAHFVMPAAEFEASYTHAV